MLFIFSIGFRWLSFLCFELWAIDHLDNFKGKGVKINNSLEINGRKWTTERRKQEVVKRECCTINLKDENLLRSSMLKKTYSPLATMLSSSAANMISLILRGAAHRTTTFISDEEFSYVMWKKKRKEKRRKKKKKEINKK